MMAGLYEWKFISNDFDQGVWVVALYSDQYQTIDGYGSPVDPNPSGEFTYPTHMSMPYLDIWTIQPSGWPDARYNYDYHLNPYPDIFPLAEIGGVFLAENAGGDRLNIDEYDLLTIDTPIISINPINDMNTNIPSSIFDEEITVRTSPYYIKNNNDGIWVISASNVYGDWYPYKIFNKAFNNRNAWLINGNVELPQYVEWTNIIDKKTKLNSYTLKMAYQSNMKYGFKKWKFEGSNNGKTWEIIHENELESTPEAGVTLRYNLNKTFEYSHFRITILDGKDNSLAGIDEIETFYTGTDLLKI